MSAGKSEREKIFSHAEPTNLVIKTRLSDNVSLSATGCTYSVDFVGKRFLKQLTYLNISKNPGCVCASRWSHQSKVKHLSTQAFFSNMTCILSSQLAFSSPEILTHSPRKIIVSFGCFFSHVGMRAVNYKTFSPSQAGFA